MSAAISPLRQHVRLGAASLDRHVAVGAPPLAVVDAGTLTAAVELTEVEAASPVLAGQRAGGGQLVLEAHEIGR